MCRSIVVCSILLVFSTSILYASSQQVAVRLNGGRTPFEGRVDVRRDGENSWKYMCGTGAGWNLTVARAVCKHLGYPAVMWEWHNGEFCGEDLSSASFLCDIRCNPLSDSLEDCSIDWDNNDCQCDQQNIAGVTCYQLNFLGRYKESRDRIFQPNTLRLILPNDLTIEECIKVCRDRQKTIAVLESGDECYCGDESVDYWRYGEAIPGLPILSDTPGVKYNTEQCSGDTGTSPYKQGCGGNWQIDVYNASFQIKDAASHQPAPECLNSENGDIEVQQNHSHINVRLVIAVIALIPVIVIFTIAFVVFQRCKARIRDNEVDDTASYVNAEVEDSSYTSLQLNEVTQSTYESLNSTQEGSTVSENVGNTIDRAIESTPHQEIDVLK